MGYRECNQIPTVGVAMEPCCEMYNMASMVGLVVGSDAPVFSELPKWMEEVEEAPQVLRAVVLVAVTAPLYPRRLKLVYERGLQMEE